MSPARSWRSACHAAGSHDWVPKKLGGLASGEVDIICTVPLPFCGTPTTCTLYPFCAPNICCVVVVDLPLLRVAVEGSDNPARRLFHLTSRGTTYIQRSSIILEVYRCVQLKRWSVVCGCVLHREQRGEGWYVSSTLCRYDIRMELLLVRSWARVRRVSLRRESSEGEILGAC